MAFIGFSSCTLMISIRNIFDGFMLLNVYDKMMRHHTLQTLGAGEHVRCNQVHCSTNSVSILDLSIKEKENI